MEMLSGEVEKETFICLLLPGALLFKGQIKRLDACVQLASRRTWQEAIESPQASLSAHVQNNC